MKKNYEKPEIKRIKLDFSESIVASSTIISWPFELNHSSEEGCYVMYTQFKEYEVQADFGKAIIAYDAGCGQKADPARTYLRMMES